MEYMSYNSCGKVFAMTIKYKEGDFVIEFESVEDLIRYKKSLAKKKEEQQKKVVVVQETPVIPKKRIKRRHIPSKNKMFKEVREQMMNKKITFNEAFVNVFNRQTGGGDYIDYKRYCLRAKLSNELDAYKQTPKKKKKSTHSPYMIKEKSWMSFRGKYIKAIMKSQNCDLQQAMKQLGATWKEAGSDFDRAERLLTSEEVDFPQFNTLSKEYNLILKGIVERCILNPAQCSISLNLEGRIIGIMDYMTWKDFVSEFMMKSKTISQHFGVPNKFRLKGRSEIKYKRSG